MFKHKHIICTEADEEIYRKQCTALVKNIPGIVKMEEVRDVDDSLVQLFMLDGKSIVVINDIGAGLVRLNSEILLEPFFEKNKRTKRLHRSPATATAPETQLA